MSHQPIFFTPRLWSCNWNWCPETFRDSKDLGKHLQDTHYNNILQVKKRDWDAYLRSTEGMSGATDSLLAAIPDPGQSTQSLSQNRMEVDEPPRRSISGSIPPRRSTSGSVRHRSPLPMTPPPVPPFPRNDRRTSAEVLAETQHPRASFNAYPSPGGERRTTSPSSSQLSGPDAKRRRMSFASYRAQSSPMSTPSVPSVPPSPGLTNMVADAINRAGQLNSISPRARLSDRSPNRKPNSKVAVPPLPRRTGSGRSPTTDRPNLSRPAPTSPLYPQSQSQTSPKVTSGNSPGAVSVGSAQAVEEALTQNVLSSASSLAPNNSNQSSSSGSSISSPRKLAHVQPHSGVGSHAIESSPQSPPSPPEIQLKVEPPPEVKPIIENPAELAYPHSNSSSPVDVPATLTVPSPPLPRRRTRSKTPAQPPAPTTRTLRSRSNSTVAAPPAASQSKSLPLPRTRTRAGSQLNASANADLQAAAPATGQRATSKPRSVGKRAGSVGPTTATAGGRKGTRANQGALAAVDEQPDEASQSQSRPQQQSQSQPVAMASQKQTQPQTQTQAQSQRPPTFRSGTLPLPRRQQLQSQLQAAARAAGRFGEDEGLDVQVKRELLDAEPLLTQSQSQIQSQSRSQHESQNESQSQDGEPWTGFKLNAMELLTQKPQSQGWGSSQ